MWPIVAAASVLRSESRQTVADNPRGPVPAFDWPFGAIAGTVDAASSGSGSSGAAGPGTLEVLTSEA